MKYIIGTKAKIAAKKTARPLPKGVSLTIMDTDNTTITNPYSGVTFDLDPLETAVYDFIKGSELRLAAGGGSVESEKDFIACRHWFAEFNNDAYFALID